MEEQEVGPWWGRKGQDLGGGAKGRAWVGEHEGGAKWASKRKGLGGGTSGRA